MYCEKCGTKLDSSALFCGECGAPIETAEKKTPKNKKNKKWIIAVIAVVVIGVIVFFGFDLGEKITSSKFDIKEYIVVKVSGYDKAGCLEAEFDIDQFIDDITNGKGFPDTENSKENNNIWSDEYWEEEDSFEEKVRDNFDVSVDKSSGLANGDKATITIDVYDAKHGSGFSLMLMLLIMMAMAFLIKTKWIQLWVMKRFLIKFQSRLKLPQHKLTNSNLTYINL